MFARSPGLEELSGIVRGSSCGSGSICSFSTPLPVCSRPVFYGHGKGSLVLTGVSRRLFLGVGSGIG